MVVTAGPTASPRVQYAYSFAPSGTTNHSRPTSMTYPDGKVINDTYTAGLDATISRLSLLSVNSVAVESYDYLGLATVVKRGHGGTGLSNVNLQLYKLSTESVGDGDDGRLEGVRAGRSAEPRGPFQGGETPADQ